MRKFFGSMRLVSSLLVVLAMAVSVSFAGTDTAVAAPSAIKGLVGDAKDVGVKADALKTTPEATKQMAAPAVYPPSPAFADATWFVPAVNDNKRGPKMLQLLANIYYGKQLDFSKDGTVFSNKEGRLPKREFGFYREYTLLVPGRKTGDGPEPVNVGGQQYMCGAMIGVRGAERLVIGGGSLVYYTPDHYRTFILLKPVKSQR